MTPQEIAQRGIDAVIHHSRQKTAAEKLEAMQAVDFLALELLADLEEAANVVDANATKAPIEGLE